LRIVDDVHIPSEVTSNVDDLIKSSTPTLEEIHVHEESISDVQDAKVESSIHIPDDIDVLEDDASDLEHILAVSSMPVQVVRYSLAIPMIDNEIEQETVDARVVISNKQYEFSLADCDYVVVPNFSLLISR